MVMLGWHPSFLALLLSLVDLVPAVVGQTTVLGGVGVDSGFTAVVVELYTK